MSTSPPIEVYEEEGTMPTLPPPEVTDLLSGKLPQISTSTTALIFDRVVFHHVKWTKTTAKQLAVYNPIPEEPVIHWPRRFFEEIARHLG